MQYILSFISCLLTVQFVAAKIQLSGTLPQKGENSFQVYLLEINPAKNASDLFSEELNADDNYRFNFVLDNNQAGFYSLTIVTSNPNGNKANYNSTVYLKKGSSSHIHFTAKGESQIQANYNTIRDPNNRALFEIQEKFNQLNKNLFLNGFNPTQTKEKLYGFYRISDSILAAAKVKPEVQKYIQFMSFDLYNSNMYRFGMELSKHPLADEKAFYKQPKDPQQFFNDILTRSFYNGITNIVSYLDLSVGVKPYSRRKSLAQIQEQLNVLNEISNNMLIKDEVIASLLGTFITQYRSSNDFETDLNAYTALAAAISNQDIRNKCVNDFENLRYTQKGAKWVDLKFRTANNEVLTLDNFKGKYVFIDVWASWCVPCIQMIPHFVKLEEQFKGENIEFIALSIDSDQKKWIGKVNQLQLGGNQLWDEQGEFSKLMNISGIPHYLLYDTEGKLIEYKTASPNAPQLKLLLERLLNQ